jgi:hypothetical protein
VDVAEAVFGISDQLARNSEHGEGGSDAWSNYFFSGSLTVIPTEGLTGKGCAFFARILALIFARIVSSGIKDTILEAGGVDGLNEATLKSVDLPAIRRAEAKAK